MTRLQPTISTIKKLFAYSGNQCAAPDCSNLLIEDNVVLGEICHIEAAEENGPRYNNDSNDEYRRSYENLILLCEKCHKKVDAKENAYQYPVQVLKVWKEQHHENFKLNEIRISDDVVKRSIEIFMEQKNQNTYVETQINNQATIQNISEQVGTKNIYYDKDNTEIFNDGEHKGFDPKLRQRIDKLKRPAGNPKEDVIDFRNYLREKVSSNIYSVPVKELKFRKENGRIKADVESYERMHTSINENTEEGQKILREFLKKSDPEKTEILKQQIKHKGQLQPAIITCDGFLVNGNRRKMVFEDLFEENHKDSRFQDMRVTILPEDITLFDIKRIENRYQLQDEGKSEYHGLNRALTLRDNMNDGYTLEAQILDDPQYADKTGSELQKAIKDYNSRYLLPLECVNRYLETFESKVTPIVKTTNQQK
ncbi:MAG: hypothetical protein IT327_31150 [Anaerolineae bacterium]|nr:hypothetical protein [Anaerolineae bacterium]